MEVKTPDDGYLSQAWTFSRKAMDLSKREKSFLEKAIRRPNTAMDEFLISASLCLSGNGLFREGYGVLDEGFFTRRRGGRGLVGTQHLPLGVK